MSWSHLCRKEYYKSKSFSCIFLLLQFTESHGSRSCNEKTKWQFWCVCVCVCFLVQTVLVVWLKWMFRERCSFICCLHKISEIPNYVCPDRFKYLVWLVNSWMVNVLHTRTMDIIVRAPVICTNFTRSTLFINVLYWSDKTLYT